MTLYVFWLWTNKPMQKPSPSSGPESLQVFVC